MPIPKGNYFLGVLKPSFWTSAIGEGEAAIACKVHEKVHHACWSETNRNSFVCEAAVSHGVIFCC